MSLIVTHAFVSMKSNGADPTLVQPSNWNAGHVLAQNPGTILGAVAGGSGQTIELPVTIDVSGNLTIIATGFFVGPIGTTGQRPVSPTNAQERYNTTLNVKEYYDATAAVWQAVASRTYVAAQIAAIVPVSGYLWGLTLATAGGSNTFSMDAGVASDTTNVTIMPLAAAISKNTSAWVVGTGNGGLDTGAIAANTWYHAYLIERVDTHVVDVLFSLNATAPTLPANYTLFRRIGSMKTDGGSSWLKFIQDGDKFYWDVSTLDVNAPNPGTGTVLRALNVPLGVVVDAYVNIVGFSGDGSSVGTYLSSLDISDMAPSANAAPLSDTIVTAAGAGPSQIAGTKYVRTNTSQQIRSRCSALSGTTNSYTLYVATLGWVDRRNR